MSSTKKAADAADPDKVPLAKAIERAAKPKPKPKPKKTQREKSSPRVKSKITAMLEQDANGAAKRENAKREKERFYAADGMTASERAMAQTEPPAKRKAVRKPDVTDRAIAEADGPGPKKLSMLDAAAIVLRDGGKWRSKALVAEMSARGLWQSQRGKTPEATLYASMTREILRRPDARFRIAGRGLFAASKAVER